MTSRSAALEGADVAFKGTVTGRADPDGGGNIISSGRTVFYSFEVDDVVKGDADNPAKVATAAEGASCGAGFEVGRRYLVFATQRPDGLTSSLCAGNERLQALPARTAAPDSEPATEPATEPAPRDPVDELLGDTSSSSPVLMILAGLAAVGAVVAVAIGRARQRKRAT